MKTLVRRLPQIAAALAFTVSTTAAIMVGGAVNAGSTSTTTAFSAAPKAADAAVFVGVGVHIGGYPRWRWNGYNRGWVRYGYGYRPGFVVGVGYVGYAAPVGPPYWAPRPVYYGGYYRPYYHPYYGRPFYGRPYYGGYYGHGYYGRGYYGRGYYGHGWRR